MHLVFDTMVLAQASRSTLARTGIHRYVSQLLPALEHWCGLEPLGYCRDPLLRRFESHGSEEQRPLQALLRHRGLQRLAKPLWRSLQASPWARRQQQNQLRGLLSNGGIDPAGAIYHSPYAAVPPEVRRAGFGAVMITIHDMLPLIQPGYFSRETVRGFKAMLASLRPGDHLLCVSNATRDDVLRLQTTVPAERVHVVPLAAATQLAPVRDAAARDALRRRFDLAPEDKLILSVGTLEPRKNLGLLLEAFERLLARHPGVPFKLLLAGGTGWKIDALLQRLAGSGAAGAIRQAGFVDDGLLATLYSSADVFVFPSLYEGFGLPPLEAMQCGTPVIVSRSSSLPELVGDAADLVATDDPNDLCAALERVLLDAGTHQQRTQQSLLRAQAFSWRRTAEATAQVYRLALGQSCWA